MTDESPQYPIVDFYEAYKEKWRDLLQPESYDHPAKVAYGLIERIYKHLMETGYIKPGDTILDPFGGVGGSAYHAMVYGMHFIGVELEQKFYDMAVGCECTGVTKEDWKRYQGRLGRIRFKDGRHICPRCVAESRMIDEKHDPKQLSLFGLVDTARYRRNSGKIPFVPPHHYTGNLESWSKKPGLSGSAMMIHGDSRRLLELLAQVRSNASGDASVSSPPYAKSSATGGWQMLGKYAEQGKLTVDQVKGDKRKAYPSWSKERDTDYAPSPENLGNLEATDDGLDAAVSSPPYGDTTVIDYGQNPGGGIAGRNSAKVDNSEWVDESGYSKSDENLGNLKYGDLDAAISSPPYAETKLDSLVSSRYYNHQLPDGSFARGELDMRKHYNLKDGYGVEDGQLGGMKDGNFDGAISSPPYANSEVMPGKVNPRTPDDRQVRRADNDWITYNEQNADNLGTMDEGDIDAAISSPPYEAAIEKRSAGSGAVGRGEFPVGRSERAANEAGYGDTEGQLGGEVGDDFWMAARKIVDQVHAALKPGGVAVWIVKDYVRDGQIVPFSQMWERLCQASGFETVEWVRAWFIEEGEVQLDFDGNHHQKRVERKSFFRRLQETKGSPRIDWESVIIMQKGLV